MLYHCAVCQCIATFTVIKKCSQTLTSTYSERYKFFHIRVKEKGYCVVDLNRKKKKKTFILVDNHFHQTFYLNKHIYKYCCREPYRQQGILNRLLSCRSLQVRFVVLLHVFMNIHLRDKRKNISQFYI